MHNYWHEIDYPENRGMRKFLWHDYFHDSVITDISFVEKTRWKYDMVMTLQCDRDWDYETGEFLSDEKCTYILTFIDVQYHCIEGDYAPPEYLNGRFKDTALLREHIRKSRKQLYHFRIKTFFGYIDIIFRDFQIRKAVGRVSYGVIDYEPFEVDEWYSIANIHERIDDRFFYEGMGDFDLFMDMEKLYEQKDPELGVYLRKCMEIIDENDEEFFDAKPYTAYLLGKYGNKNDFPYILDVYLNAEEPLIRRNAQDAIEAIKNRI